MRAARMRNRFGGKGGSGLDSSRRGYPPGRKWTGRATRGSMMVWRRMQVRDALAAGTRAARWAVLAVLAAPVAAAAATKPDPPLQAEIQIGLCGNAEQIGHALGLRPRGAATDVWLFDDAALTLFGRGVRLRLRAGEARPELTLKVADQDCAGIARELLPPDEGKCEYDLHGERLAGAVSLSRRLPRTREAGASAARELVAGHASLERALSAAQIRYLRSLGGLWPLPPDLRALGPIALTAWRTADKGYDVDVTRLPAGEIFVEIATKVPVADVTPARAALGDYLAQAGVEACADQSAQAANKLRALLRRP